MAEDVTCLTVPIRTIPIRITHLGRYSPKHYPHVPISLENNYKKDEPTFHNKRDGEVFREHMYFDFIRFYLTRYCPSKRTHPCYIFAKYTTKSIGASIKWSFIARDIHHNEIILFHLFTIISNSGTYKSSQLSSQLLVNNCIHFQLRVIRYRNVISTVLKMCPLDFEWSIV